MVPHYGDFDTTETVYMYFNTFTSDDPAASATITNLVAGDVEIHKDGSTTQRASDNGVTVTIDFDSITGNHLISIDLSDNSDAGFYANGSQYAVRIEGTTVDAGTVNAWVGAFSIGRYLRPTTNGRKLDVEAGGCAGVDWGNVANKTTANDLSATDIQLCDTITTYTGNTVQTGDAFARLGAPAGASVSADIATVDTVADAIKVVTDTLGIKKNTAWSNFEFKMFDSTDHITGKTGLTVSGQRSIDGAAFANVGGAIAEVGNGIYQFDALAADTNGDFITWRFTSAGADATEVSFKTRT